MPSDSRSVAVVTGASGGIGLELSRLLARDGHDLIIVAQHAERLAQAARELRAHGVRVTEIAADLTDPAAPPEIERELNRQGLTPDVLVNNAGFGLQGSFAKIDLGEQLRMIDLNVRALTHLTGLLLPGRSTRRHHAAHPTLEEPILGRDGRSCWQGQDAYSPSTCPGSQFPRSRWFSLEAHAARRVPQGRLSVLNSTEGGGAALRDLRTLGVRVNLNVAATVTFGDELCAIGRLDPPERGDVR
jgi:NAD(P)-dependent dehydrogenase (short-subunit alcohol dehydrogenase family)